MNEKQSFDGKVNGIEYHRESRMRDYTGEAIGYVLDRELTYITLSGDSITFDAVIVSQVTPLPGEPETYAFPADSSTVEEGEGQPKKWGELPGSKKGRHSHQSILGDVLKNAVEGEKSGSRSLIK